MANDFRQWIIELENQHALERGQNVRICILPNEEGWELELESSPHDIAGVWQTGLEDNEEAQEQADILEYDLESLGYQVGLKWSDFDYEYFALVDGRKVVEFDPCPLGCGGNLRREEGDEFEHDEPYLYCSNSECPFMTVFELREEQK